MGTAKRLSSGPKEPKIVYNYTKVSCTTTYKYLGTQIDQHLNLGENFDQKFKKASSKLQLLKRLRPLLTHEAAIAVYKSVILSALKYNCIVQLNLTRTQKDKLEHLERRAKNILNTDDLPSIPNDFFKHAVKLVR